MELIKLNNIGAYTSTIIFISCIFIFAFRILKKPQAEYWSGIVFMLMALPILYLLFEAKNHERAPLYFIQLLLMILFIFVELLFDYILKSEFRSIKWASIIYVMLFFSSTGGMIGIATHAGKTWSILGVGLFLVLTVLAFVQHSKTGQ